MYICMLTPGGKSSGKIEASCSMPPLETAGYITRVQTTQRPKLKSYLRAVRDILRGLFRQSLDHVRFL